MTRFHTFCIVLFLAPGYLFCQNDDSQNDFVAVKRNGKRKYVFTEKDCTSLELIDGTTYHVPEIVSIKKDTLVIKNRGVYADKEKEMQIKIPTISIKLINWDGFPRKKLRNRFYKFSTERKEIE